MVRLYSGMVSMVLLTLIARPVFAVEPFNVLGVKLGDEMHELRRIIPDNNDALLSHFDDFLQGSKIIGNTMRWYYNSFVGIDGYSYVRSLQWNAIRHEGLRPPETFYVLPHGKISPDPTLTQARLPIMCMDSDRPFVKENHVPFTRMKQVLNDKFGSHTYEDYSRFSSYHTFVWAKDADGVLLDDDDGETAGETLYDKNCADLAMGSGGLQMAVSRLREEMEGDVSSAMVVRVHLDEDALTGEDVATHMRVFMIDLRRISQFVDESKAFVVKKTREKKAGVHVEMPQL